MNAKKVVLAGAAALCMSMNGAAQAGDASGPYVRLAELEIDPSQMPKFTAAINQGIEAAVRTEPGVLVLYAVAEQERPNYVRVFEMYTSAAAYQTHLATPHFIKFRDSTQSMVISRKLLDVTPIALRAKPAIAPSLPPAVKASD
jgi:quinol monooxygenase YgiN